MKYKLFGKSGLRVSEFCLGTMTFGEEFGWGASKENSKKVFDTFAQAGGNFIDTANYYTRGTSEKMVGEFIAGNREYFVLATKYSLNTDPKNPNAGGNHRKNMMQSLEASLKRLNTDYIDIYWLHAWDFLTPIEEVMRAFDDMVRSGKVLYIGMSDTPAWVVSQANTLAAFHGWSPIVALQLEYSLAQRSIEPEFFSLAKAFDLAIAAWSPLAMGVLTGKYLNKPDAQNRFGINPIWGEAYLNERNQNIAQAVVTIAKRIGQSPAQVALNWICQQPGTIIPIIGAKNEEQLADNLKSIEFTLDAQDMEELNRASEIAQPFPHEFLQRPNIRQLILGDQFNNIV